MEILINNYLGSLLMMITFILFCRYIVKLKYNVKRYWVVFLILLFAFVLDTAYLFDFPIIRTGISVILYYLMLRYIFSYFDDKTILILILFMLILFGSEVIFFVIVSALFRISGNDIYMKFGGTVFGNLFIGLICLILSLIFKKLLGKLLNINIKSKMIIYWILSICSVVFFWMIVFSTKNFNIETVLVFIVMFIMLIVIFVSFYQTYKNDQLTNKYDKLLEFIKKYEIEIDNQRMIRHEVRNQLLIIKSKLIDNDNFESIVSYINEVLNDNSEKINHSEYAKLKYLPSNGIKGLFYLKVSEAIDKGIFVNINISKDVETSFLKNLSGNMFNQIGKILGIFLDNAIEGANESIDKVISIEIYANKGKVCFIISNSYLFNSISKLSSFNRSSKGISRGHGLLLAKTIISSNNKLFNQTEITDKLYIQKLEIKK